MAAAQEEVKVADQAPTHEQNTPEATNGAQTSTIDTSAAQKHNATTMTNGDGWKQYEHSPSGVNNNPRPKTKDGGEGQKDDAPDGGYDDTPIPRPPPGVVGYTIRITLHRATNLAMGDAHVFSSDGYCLAQLNTHLETRHREDPNLRYRSPTVHRRTDPEWNSQWVVANVPSSGFKLKIRVYDEDPADHDDLLGKVHVTVPQLDEDWKGFDNEPFKLKLRDSSRRAVLIRAAAKALRIVHEFRGELFVSIEMLGRTEEDGQNGRPYTVGPTRWMQHYSPILGRLTHTKEPGADDEQPDRAVSTGSSSSKAQKRKAERYNFQANQIQLPGPVPPQLYHRFVEFKPWVKRMFTTKGFQGVILGKALHHQHARVYNFGRSTHWGVFPEGPSQELTKKFLELVNYDKGGRIFTYVLTLDALWRFTETGKEFGIDMLSKHTMHSDVSIYIAFSGEFFIRRIKHHRFSNNRASSHPESHGPALNGEQVEAKPIDQAVHSPQPEECEKDSPEDPSHYCLIIDNDSGTYRPSAAMLPHLSAYLSACLPGLQVRTLDCQADEQEMNKLKNEQRERKKKEGDGRIYAQVSDSSSISSSDEEALDDTQKAWQRDGHGVPGAGEEDDKFLKTVGRDFKQHQGQKMDKLLRNSMRTSRGDGSAGAAVSTE